MKKLLIALTCLSFVGCAANPAVYKSTSQNYRPKGESSTIKIDAQLAVKQNLLNKDYAAVFYINNTNQLFFQLDQAGNGSLSCDKDTQDPNHLYHCITHNGHKIGASCMGSTANGRLASTQCAFTYDDEIAANFKF